MKTKYTIAAYLISFVIVLSLVYVYDKNQLEFAAVTFVGAVLIQQTFKMLFREHIKEDKLNQKISSQFSSVPDDDSGITGTTGKGEEYLGRPDDDGY